MAAPKGNKYALGCTTNGRPPVFDNPEQMHKKCEDYFKESVYNGEKITITGLALYLGFESRQSFYDYEDKKDFSYIIKRARLAVENSYEVHGQTIDIFALKNMGWIDKSEVNQNVKVNQFNVGFDKD